LKRKEADDNVKLAKKEALKIQQEKKWEEESQKAAEEL